MKVPFAIPRELTIRGRRWLVVREQELPADVRHTKSEMRRGVTLGQAHREKREIYLAHHDNPRLECQTFLHEVMHACVRLHKGPLTDEQEERLILHVEAPLLRALEQLEWRR